MDARENQASFTARKTTDLKAVFSLEWKLISVVLFGADLSKNGEKWLTGHEQAGTKDCKSGQQIHAVGQCGGGRGTGGLTGGRRPKK